jgi:hypothetical protein
MRARNARTCVINSSALKGGAAGSVPAGTGVLLSKVFMTFSFHNSNGVLNLPVVACHETRSSTFASREKGIAVPTAKPVSFD